MKDGDTVKMDKIRQCKAFVLMLVFMVVVTTIYVCGSFSVLSFETEQNIITDEQSSEKLVSQSIYQRDQSLTLGYSGMLKNICYRNTGTNMDSQLQNLLREFKLFAFAMLFGIALFPEAFFYMLSSAFVIPNAEQRHMLEVIQDKDGKKK